jgi:hypothetical protein
MVPGSTGWTAGSRASNEYLAERDEQVGDHHGLLGVYQGARRLTACPSNNRH